MQMGIKYIILPSCTDKRDFWARQGFEDMSLDQQGEWEKEMDTTVFARGTIMMQKTLCGGEMLKWPDALQQQCQLRRSAARHSPPAESQVPLSQALALCPGTG